ncbi:MAG: hypothetical protein AAGI38_05650 [Bacteroidota bacterium]
MKLIHILLITVLLPALSCSLKMENDLGKTASNNIISDTITYVSPSQQFPVEFDKRGRKLLSLFNSNRMDKKTFEQDQHGTSEYTYLGKWKSLDHRNEYHVLTEFTILGFVEDLIPPKGVSRLTFINLQTNKADEYRFDLPDELPTDIHENSLIFYHNQKMIRTWLKHDLPPVFCPREIGCSS